MEGVQTNCNGGNEEEAQCLRNVYALKLQDAPGIKSERWRGIYRGTGGSQSRAILGDFGGACRCYLLSNQFLYDCFDQTPPFFPAKLKKRG